MNHITYLNRGPLPALSHLQRRRLFRKDADRPLLRHLVFSKLQLTLKGVQPRHGLPYKLGVPQLLRGGHSFICRSQLVR